MHDSLRKWILLITVLSIILRYLSKIFTTEEISSLVSNDTIIMWRWMLYVGGCSIESGWQSHASKVVLVLIVLELKCCWLVRNRRGKRGEDGGESGGSSKKDEKV